MPVLPLLAVTLALAQPGTRAEALRALAGRQVVHLATYGVLNKHNPLFSFVELAPHGADDGRLEVHEVFALTLSARLVVLSACQTGLGSGALADLPAGGGQGVPARAIRPRRALVLPCAICAAPRSVARRCPADSRCPAPTPERPEPAAHARGERRGE